MEFAHLQCSEGGGKPAQASPDVGNWKISKKRAPGKTPCRIGQPFFALDPLEKCHAAPATSKKTCQNAKASCSTDEAIIGDEGNPSGMPSSPDIEIGPDLILILPTFK